MQRFSLMIMMYSRPINKKSFWNNQWPVVVVFVVVVFIVWGIYSLRIPIRNMYRGLWIAKNEQTMIGEYMVTTKKSLVYENEQLKNQIATFASKEAELKILQDENNSLRSLLKYSTPAYDKITAQIITKPSQSLFDRIIIDAGSDQGIQVNNQVVVGDGILLGTVAEVSAQTSLIVLYSSPATVLDFVIKSSGITIPGSGKGNGNFEFRVPRDVSVTDGDIIVKSGDSRHALGVVKSVQFDPRDPFQTVIARTPVNIEELKFVQVIK